MRKLMIAPSVGCCDLFYIEEQVKLINEKSDYLDYLNKHIKN